MGFLKDFFSKGAESIVGTVGETIDRFVTTDEERSEAELAKRRLELEFQRMEMEAEQAYLKDRQSARAMYEQDSGLQKIVAIVFLVMYAGISGLMLWFVLGWVRDAAGLDVPSWGISLISTVFGAMSSKVNTIVDFLFGGSQGEHEQRIIQRQFEQAARKQED